MLALEQASQTTIAQTAILRPSLNIPVELTRSSGHYLAIPSLFLRIAVSGSSTKINMKFNRMK